MEVFDILIIIRKFEEIDSFTENKIAAKHSSINSVKRLIHVKIIQNEIALSYIACNCCQFDIQITCVKIGIQVYIQSNNYVIKQQIEASINNILLHTLKPGAICNT